MGNLFQGLINRTTGWILNLLGFVFLFSGEAEMSVVCFFAALIVFVILVVELFAKGDK